MIIETDRLLLKSNCSVVDGVFCYPVSSETGIIDVFSPSDVDNGENSGFAIYLKSTSELVGHFSILFKPGRDPYELSVGVLENYRKQGYMKEAHDVLIPWIFKNCNTSSINAIVGPLSPIASEKLLTRFGFTKLPNENKWVLYRSVENEAIT